MLAISYGKQRVGRSLNELELNVHNQSAIFTLILSVFPITVACRTSKYKDFFYLNCSFPCYTSLEVVSLGVFLRMALL